VSRDANPIQAVRAALGVHREVGQQLHHRHPQLALGRGDEGGWVAPVGNLEALELLVEACARVREVSHVEVYPGLDLAASEFASEGRYRYREQTLDREGQLGFLTKLVDRYDLKYVEDPFDEEDFASFAQFTKDVGHRALVVGDDLFTTSAERVERGIRERSANAVLVKVNQVGTVSDTLKTARIAREAGWTTVASHRSGDMPEGWLAHLAVALRSQGLKCGLLGGERVAKLNELLRLAARVEG
jgi:enolase